MPMLPRGRDTDAGAGDGIGYRLFRCRPCRRTFNERTGTPFNHLQAPTDIALLVVLWRLRYKLSLRDLAEMFLTRGFTFTHETGREWEARFAPLLTERLRAKRRGKAGIKWRADEPYVKVNGRWCYLYRAIDADGHLVDFVPHQRGHGQARLFGEAGQTGRVVALEQDVGAVRRFEEVQAQHIGLEVPHRIARVV